MLPLQTLKVVAKEQVARLISSAAKISCPLDPMPTSLVLSADKSDWLRIRNDYSAHAPKIGPSLRSRFFVLSKTSASFGDEDAVCRKKAHYTLSQLL